MKHPTPAALRRSLRILCLAMLPMAAAVAQAPAGTPPAPSTPLLVERAWARATPAGVTVGAAYLVVRNPGSRPDQLVGLRSAVAERAEIHETRNSNGIMQMRQITEATVPAGGTLSLEPGGTHVMLIGLRNALVAGATVPLVLSFRHGGEVQANAVVQALGGDAPGP